MIDSITALWCECSVAQSCPTLCNPKDYSPPDSSVHEISQARTLEGVAISSSSRSFQPRNQTGVSCVSCIGRQIVDHWATRGVWLNSVSSPSSLWDQVVVLVAQSPSRVRLFTTPRTAIHVSPSNEYSGLISSRINWFDLLAVQGTLKSLLQHHSLKASVLQALSLLYGPGLTSIHDYWKNHSFD